MKKIVTVVGARPQFIKAAPVRKALRGVVHEVLVHTGQHHDPGLSDVFFEQLHLGRPDHHLGVGSGPHGRQTGRMLEALEEVLEQERPEAVLVYGDTNSTLAGALAAAKMRIPVVHVEAGVRSFNFGMPEEQNRVLVDRLSDLLLVPTLSALEQLEQEGVPGRITWIGDVMLDALLGVQPGLDPAGAWAGRGTKRRIVVTLHRAENVDDPVRLLALLEAVEALARGGWVVIWPVHPRARVRAEAAGMAARLAHLTCPPLDYFAMLSAVAGADVVVTDSGGLQKEAAYLEVPCVTLRTETEWPETLVLGLNRLVSPDPEATLAERLLAVLESLPSSQDLPWERFAVAAGSGKASERLVQALGELWA
ncbi:MAG: UDP-N-acetylglucosamine 2-epimerase (non-hydrolyzing) [Candidatus Sericytochromatia bacterium]|nr:UDP-N-acetylglucosamine 2-epimerase (non-hydrolyzing) [Candidatus Sericytochromatia bacterium]